VPDFKHFKLPDVGEGLTEAEILRWYVQPGDIVTINQVLVEIETAKAAVELPSPYAGRVSELHVAEGTTVDVGTPIITVDVDPQGAPAAVEPSPEAELPAVAVALRDDLVPPIPPPDDAPIEPGMIGGPAPGGRTSVLVGYGPRSVVAKRRARKPPAGTGPAGEAGTAPAAPRIAAGETPPPVDPPAGSASSEGGGAPADQSAPAGRAATAGRLVPVPPRATAGPEPAADLSVLAKPPVRKLAKDLGVNLRVVTGSGPNGVITRADVEAAAQPAPTGAEGDTAVRAPAPPAVWDESREQRVPIKGVRKHTAAAMVASAFTAPHVTEFVAVDVTAMMQLRQRVATLPEFAGVRLTPLLFVAKALLLAVRRHPMINSSWDEQAQEIVVKEYVNLGIAAATPRGLIVPNIKDAGRLSLRELAVALGELTETARAGRTTPADMAGGTITITNVGVFGVDTGTPILNPGETAILALGSVREMPWVVDGELAVRQVAQLSLSFDHRIVDGQLGSEFLSDIATVLSDPATALLWS
jgi:2-oxoisovalerate dehydrogenase E2 component (dihydrolipoyl transacylase)